MKIRSLIALCLLLTACGTNPNPVSNSGTDEEPAQTSSGSEEPTDPRAGHESALSLIGINPPAAPWGEMSHGDREMDMIARFLPVMHEVFEEHDAERYQEFGCGTCHGEGASEVEFHMPAASLPPVPAPGTEAYAAMSAAAPEVTQFMEERITPAMQTMLGEGAEFTCNGCHPTAE